MLQRDQDIYASGPLRHLQDEQSRALSAELQRFSGGHALLLGVTGDERPPALPLLGRWTQVCLEGRQFGGDVRAAADEPLPFLDDAFDLVLLRHALERAPVASALLEQAVRILAPGGVLAVAGVHPLGGWAPWFQWRTRGQSAPRLQWPLQLIHALHRDGLEIDRTRRLGRPFPAHGLSAMPAAFGGGYLLIAHKRRSAATPLLLRPAPVRVAANRGLSPGTRRSAS